LQTLDFWNLSWYGDWGQVIASNWNGKLKIEVNDPVCGKKTFDIIYKAVWVTSGENYVLNVHTDYDREGVTDTVVDVSATTSPWIYAHEFGHTVGLPDEYAYLADGGTVKYYKPDGTLDSAIAAPYNGKPASASDPTIMSTPDCLIVLNRHAWNIAIEVQQLLTSKMGRKITCDSV
jgi:type VI secretion system secreted protein VgrG